MDLWCGGCGVGGVKCFELLTDVCCGMAAVLEKKVLSDFLKSAVPSPCPSKQHGPFRTELRDPFHGLLVPSRGNVLAIVGREELDESSQLLVLWSPKAFHDARRGPCADEFENRSERGIRASAVGFT